MSPALVIVFALFVFNDSIWLKSKMELVFDLAEVQWSFLINWVNGVSIDSIKNIFILILVYFCNIVENFLHCFDADLKIQYYANTLLAEWCWHA